MVKRRLFFRWAGPRIFYSGTIYVRSGLVGARSGPFRASKNILWILAFPHAFWPGRFGGHDGRLYYQQGHFSWRRGGLSGPGTFIKTEVYLFGRMRRAMPCKEGNCKISVGQQRTLIQYYKIQRFLYIYIQMDIQ